MWAVEGGSGSEWVRMLKVCWKVGEGVGVAEREGVALQGKKGNRRGRGKNPSIHLANCSQTV